MSGCACVCKSGLRKIEDACNNTFVNISIMHICSFLSYENPLHFFCARAIETSASESAEERASESAREQKECERARESDTERERERVRK